DVSVDDVPVADAVLVFRRRVGRLLDYVDLHQHCAGPAQAARAAAGCSMGQRQRSPSWNASTGGNEGIRENRAVVLRLAPSPRVRSVVELGGAARQVRSHQRGSAELLGL